MKTICIALRTRPDKWKKVLPEFPKLDLQVERFNAIQHRIGHVGFIKSHQQVHRQSRSLSTYMVIEDDIKVIGTKEDLDKAISQLPKDWDCLYLGARLTKPIERYSENLFRLRGGLTTHAIIYNRAGGICEYITENAFNPVKDKKRQYVDAFMMGVQERFKCFITDPMICTQQPGFSDTCDQFCSYDIIHESYKKFTDGSNSDISKLS